MEFLSQIDIDSALLQTGERLLALLELNPAILLIAVILELMLPVNFNYRLAVCVPIFRRLSLKVNKRSDHDTQRLFAGLMLPLLIMVVTMLLMMLLYFIAGFDSLTSLVILILLLEFGSTQMRGEEVCDRLEEEDLEAARAALQPLVIREVSQLSVIGVAKAACDSMSLRLFIFWFSVMVWFLILGISGALLMAMSGVLAQAFNCKIPQYQAFGIFAQHAEEALLLAPALVFTVIMMISLHPIRILKAGLWGMKRCPAPITGLVLGLVGVRLALALGGPRIYHGEKIRYPRLGGSHQPEGADILRVIALMRNCGLVLLTVTTGFALVASGQVPL